MDRERLLFTYQISKQIVQGKFPLSKELAFELTALMAQVNKTTEARSAEESSLTSFFNCVSSKLLCLSAFRKFLSSVISFKTFYLNIEE